MIDIPKDVRDILFALNEHHHSAYVVGGCVRDFLLGKNPKDWDIATSATPEEVELIFDRVIDHGRDYGGVKVLYNHEIYDITTYRSESDYLDYRRPNKVEYSTQIIDDLQRRDYSINAIAYNEKDGLVDPYDGQADIAKKIIRCVGEADERFIEDPLRILRGIRLASDLKFDIEEKTLESMAKQSHLVEKVSKERIRNEFNRILVSKKPIVGLSVLDDVGVMPYVLTAQLSHKKIDFHHEKLLHMRDIEYVLDDRLIYFFVYLMEEADYDPHEIIDMLLDLKYSNKTIDKVKNALKLYPEIIQSNGLKQFKQIVSTSSLIDIKQLLRLARELNRDNEITKENIEDEEKMLSMIMGKHHPIFMKDLNISGKDLLEAGIPQNAQMGILMKDLLEFIHMNPEENNKEKLLQVAQEWVEKRN